MDELIQALMNLRCAVWPRRFPNPLSLQARCSKQDKRVLWDPRGDGGSKAEEGQMDKGQAERGCHLLPIKTSPSPKKVQNPDLCVQLNTQVCAPTVPSSSMGEPLTGGLKMPRKGRLS